MVFVKFFFFCISNVFVFIFSEKQNKTKQFGKISLKYWNITLLNALTSLKCSKNYKVIYKSLAITVHKKVMFHLLVFILNRHHISNKHFGDDQLT